ncbi:hypothetical protein Agub_g10230 [Astrephomene gubernaculifera]|uniref:Uncharacterized protein n=1 Tax=Astrephomene gubernaculifera TaxID=47775 RepID=A0AAD3DV01_9CHLO|nr:hypothetical protein Agub_g10230 [Astrephomene gubernaculifera]
MQATRQCSATQRPSCAHSRLTSIISPSLRGSASCRNDGRGATNCVQARALARTIPGQKDMTAELLERVFRVAVSSRLKQHGGIEVDVRSTAWGLMEGRFGGMTVRGRNWRTPLELTAEQLLVDVGELLLDYQKLVWQQSVSLRNVPQGSVSFTLSSRDLSNFMVHPIMVAAAGRAIQGKAFHFDRHHASVRFEPATGRGVVSYQGVWAGDGRRYAVTMSTPPPAAAAAAAAGGVAGRAATTAAAAAAAPNNSVDQLIVTARHVPDDDPRVSSAASGSSTAMAACQRLPDTGSFASAGSWDGGVEAGEMDPGALAVSEGLRRFFSSLMLNLQGIELRQPSLRVHLPVGGSSGSSSMRPGSSSSSSIGAASAPQSAAVAVGCAAEEGQQLLLPAQLTISMKVSIVQLPPVDMKF